MSIWKNWFSIIWKNRLSDINVHKSCSCNVNVIRINIFNRIWLWNCLHCCYYNTKLLLWIIIIDYYYYILKIIYQHYEDIWYYLIYYNIEITVLTLSMFFHFRRITLYIDWMYQNKIIFLTNYTRNFCFFNSCLIKLCSEY